VEVLDVLGQVVKFGGIGALGWILRELYAERVAERRAEKDYQRSVRARRHDRRVEVAERALTQMNTTFTHLSGMMHAFKGEMEGKVRPELTAAVIANAQERVSKLSEESHHAFRLLRFHFGDEIAPEMAGSDEDAAKASELMSEFMTVNEIYMDWIRFVEAEVAAGRADETEMTEVVRKSVAEKDLQQIQRLENIIALVRKRQAAVAALEDKLRAILWSEGARPNR
jgi:hypothetical protein